jgi:DNA invertase Pin-like site-specific DNA recombinase
MTTSALTKEGLMRAKARGVKLGNPRWQQALKTAHDNSRAAANDFALEIQPIINGIMGSGCTTYQSIADALNNRGIPTRSKKVGATWHPMTVKNLLVRIEALKK